MRIRHLLSGLLLAGAIHTPAAADISADKKEAIAQLITMTGADQVGQLFADAFIDAISGNLRAVRPDVPERAFSIVQEEVRTVMREELIEKKSFYELVYPIYDRHFTLEELNGMIRFYATPLGQKTIEVMPQLARESMIAGQAWGRSLAPLIETRIAERLRAEGLLSD